MVAWMEITGVRGSLMLSPLLKNLHIDPALCILVLVDMTVDMTVNMNENFIIELYS